MDYHALTLPGNFAAAIHKEVVYAKVKVGDEFVVLAKERLTQLGDTEYEIVEEFKGEKLVGRSYVPPFDYWQKREVVGRKMLGRFITLIMWKSVAKGHWCSSYIAPAYGEDDMNLAKEQYPACTR